MDNNNNLGLKLKQLRKTKGYTQSKLAELAGLHEKHISKLETGRYKPTLDTLNKLAKALNVPNDELNVSEGKISINDNPFYIKSMQILNNANEKELEFYYGLLKQTKIGIEIIKT